MSSGLSPEAQPARRLVPGGAFAFRNPASRTRGRESTKGWVSGGRFFSQKKKYHRDNRRDDFSRGGFFRGRSRYRPPRDILALRLDFIFVVKGWRGSRRGNPANEDPVSSSATGVSTPVRPSLEC